jgi:hypothetical protein
MLNALQKVMIVIIIMLINITELYAQKYNKKHKLRYEVECIRSGNDGTQLIKVWTYVKKPKKAIDQAKLNAIHALIFKGIKAGVSGCAHNPLALKPDTEEKHAEYFQIFFKKYGKYLQFINSSSGNVKPSDRIRQNKLYKIGVEISVNYSLLRKELENDKIIDKFGGVFE